MDELDKKIITQLVSDARASFRQVAKEIGVSTATVIKRVNNLQEMGIITGYRAEIDYAKIGYEFKTLVMVKLKKGVGMDSDELLVPSCVYRVHKMTGDYDIGILAIFKRRSDLSTYLSDLKSKPFIEDIKTEIILNTKAQKVIPE